MTQSHPTFDLFVPGRICLFGEHSDWAGSYRRINSEILPGQVIITGTNQGLHASVRRQQGTLSVRSVLPDGTVSGPHEIPMTRDALLAEAQQGGFFSYACGVAYRMLVFYNVDGLMLDNYRTTLPVSKGLSSSAALCVLIARAFNRAYDLKLTTRAEMEAAYQGEILTPSRCGRMDQGCAFGQKPVHMTFDGELLLTRPLSPKTHFPLLIVDLNGSKSTIKILADLNRAYPFASNDLERGVQHFLGPVNTQLINEALTILESGTPTALGSLMTRAQAEFDRHLQPASPEQLASPKLHALLEDTRVLSLTHGGKGVGSQGDGCAQFVARGETEREELMDYLQSEYGMASYELDLAPTRPVRKAVIPAAGFGTRMFPASYAVKKEFFPVISADGLAKPVILEVIEEALSAGIAEIALVIRPEDESLFEGFFKTPLDPDHYNRLPESCRQYADRLRDIGERISFIHQTEQSGFGHAVHCAREWVGDQPFLLLLGDHLYQSDTDTCCASQLLTAFSRHSDSSMIAVHPVPAERVVHYGTVSGRWNGQGQRILQITDLAEKPTVDYARTHLHTAAMTEDTFLCVAGQYVLTPAIFEHLGRDIAGNRRANGEFQLTAAMDNLRRSEGLNALRIEGRPLDTGLPETYARTVATLAGLAPHPPGQKQEDSESSD
ncbi:MAG: sugar phosphate nucleotidyltransferase [Verrucomicrobiota bacterium]